MQLGQLNLILSLPAWDYFRYCQLLLSLVLVVAAVAVMMVLISAHLAQYLQRIKLVISNLPTVTTVYNYDLLPR
jgi:hypothetical protein